MPMLIRLFALAAALSLPVAAEPVADVDAEARELFHALMSPYCPGSLLAECPSYQAAVLRDSVRARLGRGQSPEQIRADLVRVYGDEILASPPFAGLGTLTWLGVAAIFLGGLGAAAGWLRHRRMPAPAAPPRPPATGDLERLRRDLAQQDRD